MALLNNTCTYAIRAALYVAAAQPAAGTFVSTRKIAEDLEVPFAFLTKVLLGLTQSGILLSQRGATGGVALARASSSITLLDVLTAVGGDGVLRECLLGLPTCSDVTPCAVHEAWRDQRERLFVMFEQTTLAALAVQAPTPAKKDVAAIQEISGILSTLTEPTSMVISDDPNPAAGKSGRGTRRRRAT